MQYILMEIQIDSEGVLSTIVATIDDERTAESRYYALLSICAVSQVAHHGACLMTERGNSIYSKMYDNVISTSEE